MITNRWIAWTAAALGAWFLAVPSVTAGPGPMQVEEPKVNAAQPPIQPEKDQESWKARKKAGLTPDQQAALNTRQQTMKDMMVLIQQKRRALKDARPEDRQALAQELHNLIIEKGLVTNQIDRSGNRMGKDARRDGTAEKSTMDPAEMEKAARVREERSKAAEQKARQVETREEKRRWQWENKGNSRNNGSDDD